jgi:adsorption protein B
LYGSGQALLSILRAVWGNVINFSATVRALKVFGQYLLIGTPITWEKTDHAYPSEAELARFRRRLGDLLLERRFVTVRQLDQALARQKETGQKLGSVLVDMGFLEDEKLLQTLGMQFSVLTTEVDPYAVDKKTIALIPEEIALRHQIFPIDVSPGGAIIAAVNNLPSSEELHQLEKLLNRSLELRLTTRGELWFALRRGYDRLRKDVTESKLGQVLLKHGLINSDQLKEALRRQRRKYRNLGDILLAQGLINVQHLASLKKDKTPDRDGKAFPLGERLVSEGVITRQQLDSALDEQKSLMPRLGEIMVDAGMVERPVLESIVKKGWPAALEKGPGKPEALGAP